MLRSIRFVAAAFVFAICVRHLLAQHQTAGREVEVRIENGQSIADVQRLLQSRGVKFARQALAFSIENPDTDYILFDLDKDQSFAVVFYSKTNRAVTSISFVAWPEGNHTKSTRAWFRAKSILLESDGGYAVKFMRPLSNDEKPRKRKVEEPTPKPVGDDVKKDDRP